MIANTGRQAVKRMDTKQAESNLCPAHATVYQHGGEHKRRMNQENNVFFLSLFQFFFFLVSINRFFERRERERKNKRNAFLCSGRAFGTICDVTWWFDHFSCCFGFFVATLLFSVVFLFVRASSAVVIVAVRSVQNHKYLNSEMRAHDERFRCSHHRVNGREAIKIPTKQKKQIICSTLGFEFLWLA